MTLPAYSLSELETLALQRADMVNSDQIGTTERSQAIDNALEALSNLLITIQGGRIWSAKKDFTYTAGLGDTGLGLTPAAIYKLLRVGLYYPNGTTNRNLIWLEPVGGEDGVRDLEPTGWGESVMPRYLFTKDRNFDPASGIPTATSQTWCLVLLPPPTASWTVRIEYFPMFKFTGNGSTNIVNLPFPEYVIIHAAKTFATKEQNAELIAILKDDLADMERQIRAYAAPLDRHEPGFITDKRGELDLDSANAVWGWR